MTAMTVRALPLLLVTSIGCAALSGESACPEVAGETLVAVPPEGVKPTCSEARLDAQALYERAVAELKQNQPERGYRSLALIHIQYPQSEPDREVFVLAARVFQRSYFRHRAEPGSVWVGSEPQFMFGWLAQFFREGDEFPQRQVDALFLGMHYGMFRDFLAWAKENAAQPPGLSRWVLSAGKDDGIVYSVTAVRSDGSA